MRKIRLVVRLLGVGLGFLLSPTDQAATVSSHEIEIRVDPVHRILTGESRLSVEGINGTKFIDLRLGSDFRISAVEQLFSKRSRKLEVVSLANESTGAPLRIKSWRVALERTSAPTVQLRIRWSGCPSEELIPRATEDGSHPTGFLGPAGLFLPAEAGWYPTGDQAVSNFTLTAFVPPAWRVISEGESKSSETAGEKDWRRETYSAAHPLEGISLVAAPYQVKEIIQDGQRLAFYSRADSPLDFSSTYLSATGRFLARFSRQFGVHPWPQYVVVENFLPFNHARPSFLLLASTALPSSATPESILGHEILRDWWGHGVFVDPRAGDWSEGLVTILADQALEAETQADGGRGFRRQILADYAQKGASAGSERTVGDSRENRLGLSSDLGRGRVAMIFHMLRREIGEPAFFDGLRDILQSFIYRRASWNDLETSFSRRSRRPLGAFFSEWLSKPGAPAVSFNGPLVHGRVTDSRELFSARLKVTPGWSVRIPFRLEYEDETGESGRQERAFLSDPVQGTVTVQFPVGEGMAKGRILLDPDVDFFRLLSPEELPVTFSRVLSGTPPSLVVAGTGRPGVLNDAQRLLAGRLSRGALVLSDGTVTVEALDRAQRLLVVGYPDPASNLAKWLAGRLPAGFRLEEDRLQLLGKTTDSPLGWAAFILPGGADRTKVLCIVDALGPAAFDQLARRLDQFERYSFLLFQGEDPLVQERDGAPGSSGEEWKKR